MSNRRYFQDYLLKSLEASNQLRESKTTLDAELSRCGALTHPSTQLRPNEGRCSGSAVVLGAATAVLALDIVIPLCVSVPTWAVSVSGCLISVVALHSLLSTPIEIRFFVPPSVALHHRLWRWPHSLGVRYISYQVQLSRHSLSVYRQINERRSSARRTCIHNGTEITVVSRRARMYAPTVPSGYTVILRFRQIPQPMLAIVSVGSTRAVNEYLNSASYDACDPAARFRPRLHQRRLSSRAKLAAEQQLRESLQESFLEYISR